MESIKNLKIFLEAKILESSNVVIVPHRGVDFDAIASALGLSFIAKELEKPSCIIVDDPIYKIDRGVGLIIEEARPNFTIINKETYLQTQTEEDLFILTDVNKTNLIYLKEQLQNPSKTIIIDHHEMDQNTVEADYKFINPKISSASEIVAKVLHHWKLKYPRQVANYLLAGIYLDTNKLTKNISSETMNIVARLLDSGANMNQVMDWFAEDFNSDRKVQQLINQTEMINYSIAIAVGSSEEEFTKEELAKAADYLLKFKVDAAFTIGNIGENVISISGRSKEKVNIGFIMQALQGGGNKHSGATKLENCTLEEAEKRLRKQIQPPYYSE